MNHTLKIEERFADAVCPLKKTFEVRREDDRRFEVGDRIAFLVVDADGDHVPSHALNRMEFRVTYVLRGYGVEDGHAVIAIKPVKHTCLDYAVGRSLQWADAPLCEWGREPC